MKNFVLGLLLFTLTAAFAQTSTPYRVVDSLTQQPLELATVRFLKSDYTTFTNAHGDFSNPPEGETEAEISYIGYATKIIALNGNAIIELNLSAGNLSEVVIEYKKATYSNSKKIRSAKASEYLGFQFGTENCTYVQNPYNKPGTVSSVTLSLSKLKNYSFVDRTLGNDKNCKGCKVDYVASYKISFYAYDTITKQPGNKIYSKDIVVYPENKTCKFSVNLNSLSIPFPKNGVCVGVEQINTRYKSPKNTFAFIGPTLGFNNYMLNEEPKSWIRYRNEGWNFKNVITGFQKGKTSRAMAVDVKIKI